MRQTRSLTQVRGEEAVAEHRAPREPPDAATHNSKLEIHHSSDVRQFHAVSPLPPAAELRELEAVHPGITERLLAGQEKEQAHRHQLESSDQRCFEDVVRADFRRAEKGQTYAMVVSIAGFAAATAVSLLKSPLVGGVIAGLDIVALASAFLYASRRNLGAAAEARAAERDE